MQLQDTPQLQLIQIEDLARENRLIFLTQAALIAGQALLLSLTLFA